MRKVIEVLRLRFEQQLSYTIAPSRARSAWPKAACTPTWRGLPRAGCHGRSSSMRARSRRGSLPARRWPSVGNQNRPLMDT